MELGEKTPGIELEVQDQAKRFLVVDMGSSRSKNIKTKDRIDTN